MYSRIQKSHNRAQLIQLVQLVRREKRRQDSEDLQGIQGLVDLGVGLRVWSFSEGYQNYGYFWGLATIPVFLEATVQDSVFRLGLHRISAYTGKLHPKP